MVEHAMHFDADGDGKLNRDELMKFAQDFARHAPPPRDGRGPGRGPDDEGPSGPPRDDNPPGRPERPE
jgi:hypothetical protein